MKRHILLPLLLFLCTAATALAQNIRYVAPYGEYANDGTSWAKAKKNIQDAINDLYSKGLTGEVWVAQGTYSPTESTESEGGSTLYMSFKVYPGITVRGGFYGLGPDGTGTVEQGKTVKRDGQTYTGGQTYAGENLITDRMELEYSVAVPEYDEQGEPTGATRAQSTDKSYLYETTLSGDLSQESFFTWNETKQYWDASFYGNSYHVVWFATNGFDANGRANALKTERGNAVVEGFVIKNGNAHNTDIGARSHTAYGGGVYMVKGSRLENCRVVNCEASRDGGGIYMDGGGVVQHCYIANCQALGIGVENGYGGGVCVDANVANLNAENGLDDRFGIYRSCVVGNVGRLGGGLAVKYDGNVSTAAATQLLPEYLACASAVLVANNTATTEGGGVYTEGGGAMTNMSIVRNRCNGTGVIAGGIVTGRAGGLYCRDHALVLNSVLWGNACEANKDIQYASSKSKTGVKNVEMKYCAVSLADNVDWSTTTTSHVFSIMNYNSGVDYRNAGLGTPKRDNAFPNFSHPSRQAGWYDDVANGILRTSCWVPAANSCLANAGIVSQDLNTSGSYPFTNVPTDVLGKGFTSHSTLGAYTRSFLDMTPAAPVTASDGKKEWHFYVDPNAPTYTYTQRHGISWDSPARYLGNVIYTIKEHKLAAALGVNYETDKFVIHVKEGSTDNTNSYGVERVRNVAFHMPSNTTVLGGYPEELTGTLLESADGTLKRNPVQYPTFIRGDLMDDYDLNASHLFRLNGVHDVTIDGLQLRNANARSTMLENDDTRGAAINIKDCNNITVRNVIIAGCTAERGSATYVWDSKNVLFENCIIHNNEAATVPKAEEEEEEEEVRNFLSSIVYLRADKTDAEYLTTFRHCNIMNNVGFGIAMTDHASLTIENSMAFANMERTREQAYYSQEREKEAFEERLTAPVYRTAESYASSMAKLTFGNDFLFGDIDTIQVSLTEKKAGTLSYKLNEPNRYPRFVNGVINVGVSSAGDVTFFGRGTSFMPHNENPMTNGAVYTDASTAASTDMSSVITRNYGGLPDIGAIENHASQVAEDGENAYPGGQPAVGEIIYVKEDGDDSNDGLSWDKPKKTVQAAIDLAKANPNNTNEIEWDVVTNNTEGTPVVESCVIESIEDVTATNDLFNTNIVPISETTSEPVITTTTNPVTGVVTETKVVTTTKVETRNYYQLQSISNTANQWILNGNNVIGANNATLNNTVGANAETSALFYFEGSASTCRIRTFSDRYLYRNSSNLSTSVSEYTNFSVNLNDQAFRFSYATTSWWTTTYYIVANGASTVQVTTSNSNNYWKVKKIKVRTTTISTETTTTIKTPKPVTRYAQVWVAEGTYTRRSDVSDRVNQQRYSIELKEGVNVYGGFPKAGYPAMDDRNPRLYVSKVQPGDPLKGISQETINTLRQHGLKDLTSSSATAMDSLEYRAHSGSTTCGSYGRVVVMASEFEEETVFDGFTISNGFLNTTYRRNVQAKLYRLFADNEPVGKAGGAGVYLLEGGVLENCIVEGNMTFASPEYLSEEAQFAEESGVTYIAGYRERTGACHTVGAGVYNNGGTIKNCEIANNMILFELKDLTESGNIKYPDAAGLYGAGIFQEKGTVYNTIIHDNKLKVTNLRYDDGINNSYSETIRGYDDPYSTNGKTNNEFWDNNTAMDDTPTDCNQYLAGAGVFLISGEFYNNTVVNNTYRMWPTRRPGKAIIGIGGVYAYNDAVLYNSIIANNEPKTLQEAGLANPVNGSYLRSSITNGTTNATYVNYPIICFNINASSYQLKDDALTVHYSAVDYKSANDIRTAWGVTNIANANITNQCLEHDVESSSGTKYTFSAANSYGYSANNAECNYSGTNHTASTGTNWYGLRGSGMQLYDPKTYQLTSTSLAMNNGTNDIPGVTLPDVDADYSERIKDCTVDMGAYEFDDSYAITPRTIKDANGNVDKTKAATFYVTPEGRGLASANDPSNAACAAKLQRVLDAAGRYKFQNPTQQVIVKVATYADGTKFQYYATRTTDESDTDMRVWSIIVPRGVEVWGGYSDAYTSDDNNGFYTRDNSGTVTDNRDITKNQTQFDSYYYSTNHQTGVNTYHVITFTDRVFDGEGKAYAVGDALTGNSNWNATTNSSYMLMGRNGGVTERAVIDGIFITGGQADLRVRATSSKDENINSYGGAAIVTDYAHVRNCIVRDNQGVRGGALALTHNALVTGCLLERNSADYGGAIYVFPNGTTLSNGITVASNNSGYGQDDSRYDVNMARVLSSTIVNNDADVQGGGVWFTDNARFLSVAVWQNRCQDQANIRGQYSITREDGAASEKHLTTEYFPFNYSAVQNIRPSGINNVSLGNNNRNGSRFSKNSTARGHQLAATDEEQKDPFRFGEFNYYLPSSYSVLMHGGMPVGTYEEYLAGESISELDFMGQSRTVADAEQRRFLEIGALANMKTFNDEILMLRLFVAQPDDVDSDAAYAMMQANDATPDADDSYNAYYSQEGSSFAYPFNRLQDALDYIYRMRGLDLKTNEFKAGNVKFSANNMPFEIWMGRGTYIPSIDLTRNYNHSAGNTFLVPEGVTIVGGYDPSQACHADGPTVELPSEENGKPVYHFFGAYNQHDETKAAEDRAVYYVDQNTSPMKLKDNSATAMEKKFHDIVFEDKIYRIHQVQRYTANDSRELADINANSVIEPWEFAQQTILSGQVEGEENDGVNHIVTIVPDQSHQGALPRTQGALATGEGDGWTPRETGQIIAFDGLTFTGGYAYGYRKGSVNDEHKMQYNQGGAIMVDGNRYNNGYNAGSVAAGYKNLGSVASAGFREIPVMVNQCKFENNLAGYGGAISTNTTLDVVNSTFEHNRAMAGEDKVDVTLKNGTTEDFDVVYPGVGAAIYSTYQVTGINTMFANNEATAPTIPQGEGHSRDYTILTELINEAETGTAAAKHTLYTGSGGCAFIPSHGYFHFMNCNFVRNQAFAFPAIFTMNPNYQAQIDGNNGTILLKNYNQVFNSVFWGNAINPDLAASHGSAHLEKINRIVNYGEAGRNGGAYDIDVEKAPNNTTLDDEAQYTEQIWFSAYEAGRGKSPHNNRDMRDFVFDPRVHVKKQLSVVENEYQNCNILLDSENYSNEGPNFVNPSQTAGYAGYVESADWSPARLCNLTDNGWGRIKQEVVPNADKTVYTTNFLKYSAANPVPNDPEGRDEYSSETIGDANTKASYVVDGAYTTMRYMKGNEKYQMTVPIGDDEYMYSKYPTTTVEMHRISKDPNPTQNQTYIDIGVYEYQHTPLEYDTKDEVDIIWVSSLEKPENGLPNGKAWSQPTSDLQRAIETLLSSRNGHRKEIRLMDGTFTPIYNISHDGVSHQTFYINTEKQNNTTELPADDNGQALTGRGVKSLTIKGGYSRELENIRNVDEYPAIVRQQKRTDGTSAKWDHLFYIADATQRYGMPSYSTETGGGHLSGTDNDDKIYTIPIEFDGVRLINDQALGTAEGSAIYYAPLQELLDQAHATTAGYDGAQTEITSTPANVSLNTLVEDNVVQDDEYVQIDSPAKLIISKSQILGSGGESAVYLGDKHGHGILYNNVLHSNAGSPVKAGCRALTVNNTFARNGGPLKLLAENSTIHNSVLWRNNPTGDTYGDQFLLQGFNRDGENEKTPAYDGVQLSHNTYTNGPTKSVEYGDGNEVAQHAYNTDLSVNNDDVMSGPNFVNPGKTATDTEERDFSFMPSMRLMNKGTNARYTVIEKAGDAATNELYDLAINTTYYEDAASRQRFMGSIDIGAYEYQNELRRVLFVNPLNDIQGTGESWAYPIGRGGIQDAVDLAALYHAENKNEQAFVFVKGAMQGDKEAHTGESITLQDGVTVFGCIDNNLGVMPDSTELGTTAEGKPIYAYTDQNLQDYLLYMDGHSEGLVGPNTFRTAINGIRTNPYAKYNTSPAPAAGYLFPITSQIAGFHVTTRNNAQTEPVINIDPQVDGTGNPKVALQSIAVYDNKYAKDLPNDTKPLVYVKNALVYNSLFRDNDADTLVDNSTPRAELRFDTGGYAVNISAQGKTETNADGTTFFAPFNGHGIEPADYNYTLAMRNSEKANRIIYSVVNYSGEADPAVSPEIADQTKYTLSGNNYRRNDRNMYFQLAEGSKHINEIPLTLPLDRSKSGSEDILPEHLRSFVNYNIDRDMIGNPRVLTLMSKEDIAKFHSGESASYAEGMHLLDRGCFETWFINDKVIQTAAKMENAPHYTPRKQHFTPHTGSVVYINEDCNLICGENLQPGFLLLKQGASLYGNGKNVKVSYIAVEREIHPNGSVVSMPFPMDYSAEPDEEGMYVTGIARAYYQDAAGNVTAKMENSGVLHLDYAEGEHTGVYDYMPEERMAPEYEFGIESGAWRDLTTTTARGNTQKAANQGVLIVPDMDAVKAATNSKGEKLYTIDEATGTVSASSPVKLIYSFTARGEFFDSYVYEETEDETSKTVTLGQYDYTESTGNHADFTSKENMGWNCIGIPYLVSDYRTFNDASTEGSVAVSANAYAVKAGAPATHYNMHIPHTLWLYYDGVKAPDGTEVDGKGGFYSVPSWENTPENSWHLGDDTPSLWMGEGIFTQTASVTGSEDLTFYRPVYIEKQSTTETETPSPAVRKKATTRYYVDEDIDEEVVRLSISVRNRTIYVRGLQGGEQLAIHDIPGRCYQMATAREGRPEWSYAVSHPGIYIVTVNGVGRKVVVK